MLLESSNHFLVKFYPRQYFYLNMSIHHLNSQLYRNKTSLNIQTEIEIYFVNQLFFPIPYLGVLQAMEKLHPRVVEQNLGEGNGLEPHQR